MVCCLEPSWTSNGRFSLRAVAGCSASLQQLNEYDKMFIKEINGCTSASDWTCRADVDVSGFVSSLASLCFSHLPRDLPAGHRAPSTLHFLLLFFFFFHFAELPPPPTPPPRPPWPPSLISPLPRRLAAPLPPFPRLHLHLGSTRLPKCFLGVRWLIGSHLLGESSLRGIQANLCPEFSPPSFSSFPTCPRVHGVRRWALGFHSSGLNLPFDVLLLLSAAARLCLFAHLWDKSHKVTKSQVEWNNRDRAWVYGTSAIQ